MQDCNTINTFLDYNRINSAMKDLNSYSENVSSEPAEESENFSHDPLDGVGNTLEETKYFRVDSVVFAEPLNVETLTDHQGNMKAEPDEFIFIDNVMVQQSKGKKNKKYHIDIKDPANPTCPQPNCSKSFTSTTLLKAHIRKVHCAERNKYVCERCGVGFPADHLLRRHSATHGGERIQCPVCHKMLSPRTNLTVHLRSHSEQRPHQCSMCSKRFGRKSTLNTHIKFLHRSGELQCELCDAKFKFRSEWTRHLTSHRSKQ